MRSASKDTIIYYKESNLLKTRTESYVFLSLKKKKRSLKGDASQPPRGRAFALGGVQLSAHCRQHGRVRQQQLTRRAAQRGAAVCRCMRVDGCVPHL